MDFHKDFEDYYNAKKKLFLQTSKCSVINIDDPYGKRLFDELKAEGRPVKSCASEDENADYRALVREKSVSGTRAEIFRDGESLGRTSDQHAGNLFGGKCGRRRRCGSGSRNPVGSGKGGIRKTRG